MNKLGSMTMKHQINKECLDKCLKYIDGKGGQLIRFTTPRGITYGVLVTDGEKMWVWNSFTGKYESYSKSKFVFEIEVYEAKPIGV